MVTSTGIMVIATTSAAALGTAEALGNISTDQIDAALGTLVFCVGVLALLAGLLRLGRYTRFVSHSVMTGFLTGVSLILILSQFGDLSGTPRPAPTAWRRRGTPSPMSRTGRRPRSWPG